MPSKYEVTFTPDDRAFVCAVVRRVVADEDVQDVAQDALLVAFRRQGQYRGEARYHTWLYRIAITTAIGHVRARRRQRITHLEVVPDVASDEPSIVDRLASGQHAGRVLRAFAQLPVHYRDVLERRVDEEPDRAIADALGITMTSVKVRAFRGRQRLREVLEAA